MTTEQARDVAECLRALTCNRNDGSAYLIAAETIDALVAENELLREAVKAMVEDGWLYCGAEGLSSAQEKCLKAMKGTS